MNINFTLTKDNVGEFRKRFAKMVSYTGMIRIKSYYSGAKQTKRMLNELGIKSGIHVIAETNPCYIDKNTYKIDIISDYKTKLDKSIVIRPNSGGCLPIPFGSKMKFTPRNIIIIGAKFIGSSRYHKTIYEVFSDIELGKSVNRHEERMDKEYWEQCELEMMDELY